MTSHALSLPVLSSPASAWVFWALTLGALLLLPLAATADEWEVFGQEEGVVLSRRPNPGSPVPELRSVSEIEATPFEILAVIDDVAGHVEWRPDCVVSKTVRTEDPLVDIVYSLSDAPWPVADRESVTRVEIVLVNPPNEVAVHFTSTDAPEVEGRPGAVRIPHLVGSWEIRAIDDKRSRVQYTVRVDPGGSVPDWLVAMRSRQAPLRSMVGLRERVADTRGRYDEQIRQYIELSGAS